MAGLTAAWCKTRRSELLAAAADGARNAVSPATQATKYPTLSRSLPEVANEHEHPNTSYRSVFVLFECSVRRNTELAANMFGNVRNVRVAGS
jgi:hypothetical protein